MGEHIDRVAKHIAESFSRRRFVEGITGGFAILLLGENCGKSTEPSKPCQNCCRDYPAYNCCEQANVCCGAEYPHHCQGNASCFRLFTDAQRVCGNAYEVCYGCRYV